MDKKSNNKNPLQTSKDNVRRHYDEEFGTTILHENAKDDSKKLPFKEVLKKMDENQRGMV